MQSKKQDMKNNLFTLRNVVTPKKQQPKATSVQQDLLLNQPIEASHKPYERKKIPGSGMIRRSIKPKAAPEARTQSAPYPTPKDKKHNTTPNPNHATPIYQIPHGTIPAPLPIPITINIPTYQIEALSNSAHQPESELNLLNTQYNTGYSNIPNMELRNDNPLDNSGNSLNTYRINSEELELLCNEQNFRNFSPVEEYRPNVFLNSYYNASMPDPDNARNPIIQYSDDMNLSTNIQGSLHTSEKDKQDNLRQ